MIKSMTGYGASVLEDKKMRQCWEIKSVNSKQLNLRWRMPGYLKAWEQVWEKKVREVAYRGRVDIYLDVEFLDPDLAPAGFNFSLARAMVIQVEQFAQDNGQNFVPDYNRLFNVGALWKERSPGEMDSVVGTLEQGLVMALEDWNLFREREGRALQTDLLTRVDKMKDDLERLVEICPQLAARKFSILRERLAQLTNGLELEKERLFQELALLTDRLDVSEELTRLRTHLQRLQELLSATGPGEGDFQGPAPGGKRLDFLLQECFREVNTCGNKAQDPAVSQIVVELKTELEKCREQVQNIE